MLDAQRRFQCHRFGNESQFYELEFYLRYELLYNAQGKLTGFSLNLATEKPQRGYVKPNITLGTITDITANIKLPYAQLVASFHSVRHRLFKEPSKEIPTSQKHTRYTDF